MEKLNGKIIVLEGAGDGVGKTTQFNLLKKYLIENGYDVYTHHFPSYNSKSGKLVVEYLKGNFGNPDELSPYFVHMLYAQDRAIIYNKEIEPEIKKGKVILLDRYTTSSLIYQSSNIDDIDKKIKFINFVKNYEYKKLKIKEPDYVIFLYASLESIKKLKNQRKNNDGVINDIHESNNTYINKVYYNSIFVANNQKFDFIDCERDNEIKSKEEIHNDIKKLLLK